jgi:hypothetical protein
MMSSSNKISIPKEVFENLFFAEGGQKKDLFKALTGEYQFALDSKKPMVEPNAEIEGGEYIFDSQGIRKAQGKTHEKGGMPVALEDGTRILSDHLKIGADVARKVNKELGLPAKATDTYAKILDRFNSKTGLDKINAELEKLMGMMKDQKLKIKDKKTSDLNSDYLSKQLYKQAQSKKPIEKDREMMFNIMFQIQEESKEKDSTDYKMENGGIVELANKYGISEEKAAKLLKDLPKYQTAGKFKKTITGEKKTALGENKFSTRKREKQKTGVEAYGDVESAQEALQQLYRNFPDLVYSDDTLKENVEIDNRGNLKFKNNVKLNTQQKVIGSLQSKMNDRMAASAQNIISNASVYGEDAVKQAQDYLTNQTFNEKEIARGFDSKLGQFTSGRYSMGMNLVTPEDKKFLNDNGIFTLRQLKTSPLRDKLSTESLKNVTDVEKQVGETNADYAINQFNVKQEPIKETPKDPPGLDLSRTVNYDFLSLPQRIYQTPTLNPALKVATRLNRIEPNYISPTQKIMETDRAVVAAQQNLSGMSDAQRAAANIGLTANQGAAAGSAITEANRFNNQAQNTADIYNAKIGDAEQMAENQNALSYEARTYKGLANYENDWQNLRNTRFNDQYTNWDAVASANAQNALNKQVQLQGDGTYRINYKPETQKDYAGQVDSLINPYGITNVNATEAEKKAKEKTTVGKFGGRFKKKK